MCGLFRLDEEGQPRHVRKTSTCVIKWMPEGTSTTTVLDHIKEGQWSWFESTEFYRDIGWIDYVKSLCIILNNKRVIINIKIKNYKIYHF